MGRHYLFAGVSLLMISVSTSAAGQSPSASRGQDSGILADIIVTAQKRTQLISDVGMSIDVQTGDQLTKLGITDPASLSKVTPGMVFTPTAYGNPIYTIRGVGFHDVSLAGSPTVSIYVDEVPLPFSVMTIGTSLDVQRVEVLKGPQGILFGQNATGGAINYIANKPTDELQMGFDASYGRFSQFDFQGYVSGPLSDTLKARLAIRRQSMGNWQKGYTIPLESGQRGLTIGRLLVDWEPADNFRASVNINGWVDTSDTQVGQFYGAIAQNPSNPIDPRVAAYPLAPHNARAADRGVCVNTSNFDEPYNLIPPPYFHDPLRPIHPDNCTNLASKNHFVMGSLRLEYDLSDSITLTSLTAYEHYDRRQPIEGDGTIYQVYEALQTGHLNTLFQELRLSGDFLGKGSWIVGGNFEHDKTHDKELISYGNSSSNPTVGYLQFISAPVNDQTIKTYAAFANVEYPVTDTITAHAGIRYTKVNRSFHGCTWDTGTGTWARASQALQNVMAMANGYITLEEFLNGEGPGINVGPGGCPTVNTVYPYHPESDGYRRQLNQSNVPFRVGIDWKPVPDILLYVNVSRGFKAQSFPTVAAASAGSLVSASQEQLTAYEAGFKTTLFERHLQLNGAVFYYDYKDKQIMGTLNDIAFGGLPALVNIPKSRVTGFELSGVATPVNGLTLMSGVSFVKSKVTEDYFDYDPFPTVPVNFKGQSFPMAPRWQFYGDIQYDVGISDTITGFIGVNVNYKSGTRSFFYNPDPDPAQLRDDLLVPGRTLIDMRAGIEAGPWRVQAYVRNLTDKWYWEQAWHAADTVTRITGLPRTFGLTVSWKY